jgi:hypothetical protein
MAELGRIVHSSVTAFTPSRRVVSECFNECGRFRRFRNPIQHSDALDAAREHYDANACQGRRPIRRLEEFPAIHSGHLKIKEHETGWR